MKKKLLAVLLAATLLLGCLAGCGAPAANEPSSDTPPAATESAVTAPAPEKVVTDMAGRQVTIPAEINTIATFGAIGVLNAFVELMGAGNKICNDMSPTFTKSDKWAMQYQFAPQISGAPVFENADREIQIEEVLAVHPDLCITMTQATAEYLAENGLTVIYLSWSEVSDVKTAVTLMGEVLGAEDIAADYISYFDATVAKAETLVAGLEDSEKKTVLYGDVTSLSQPHMIAEWWIGEAGGISVTAEAHTEESLTYTTEDLLAWDPDVMFVTSKQAEDLKADTQLAGITAIQNDAIYYVPTVAHVWGNRTVEQPLTILWAVNKLYPQLLSTEELSDEISYFYSHFFLYDMSDEQIAAIIG